MGQPDELIPTSTTLLRRLRDSEDDEAWQTFFDTYQEFIYTAALNAGLSDADAQDAVQETLISVSKAISNFEYHRHHGSFKSWLLRLASWRIVDEIRKRSPSAEPEGKAAEEDSLIEQIPDPEFVNLEEAWEEELKKSLLAMAIRRVRRKSSPQQYQMFDFHTKKGWPVEKISDAMQVSAEQVYLATHRIRRRIEEEIESLQAQLSEGVPGLVQY